MNNTTFVLSFFNLRRKEKNELEHDMTNSHFVNQNDYIERSKELLSRPFNVIIFTEPEYKPIFEEIRKNLKYKTRIITFEYENLPYWEMMDKIRENDEVTFDVSEGRKGLNAINVKKA